MKEAWIRRVALRASQGVNEFGFRRYISLFEGLRSSAHFGTIHRLLVSLSGLSAMRRFSCTYLSSGNLMGRVGCGIHLIVQQNSRLEAYFTPPTYLLNMTTVPQHPERALSSSSSACSAQHSLSPHQSPPTAQQSIPQNQA